MAVTRKQTVPSTPYLDSGAPPKGNVSLGRSTNFGNLFLATAKRTPILVGGMQSFYVEETNGTQWRTSAGSDWLEPVYGPRMWQGEGQRWQIRGADLSEILQIAYPRVADMDFRYLPFVWQYQFHYSGFNPDANNRFPAYESAQWSWMTIIVVRHRWSMPSANDLLSEDFSFIGKGITRADNGKQNMNNPSNLGGRV